MGKSAVTIYKGRENIIPKKLSFKGVFVALDYVTKMQLVVNSIILADSSEDAEAFDWDTGVDGEVYIKVGELATFPVGTHKPYLIVFDAANDNGINYGQISFKVLQD
jgi:hypothetical protein